ncbi:MAG: ChbG/HpnK family deacetylase, partial [Planctomycetes bacterium]|nr:ChbG/HpnK family deacetylase [Planctomycetota bacterium]
MDRAVERAHREGVLTSASLVACGATAEGALALARRNPELGIGVHLTLVGERALLPHARLSHLTDGEGRLPRGHGEFARRFLTGGIPLAEVEAELEAQVGRVRDSGIRPTHLDGHQHLHLLPGVLGAVLRLARRHGIAALRLPLGPGDPWWRGRLHASLGTRLAGLLAARAVRRSGLVHPGRVLGIADTGRLDGERIRRLAEGIPEG